MIIIIIIISNLACKLLERLITQQIKEYLEATNALHNAQHGFRSNRSTTSNMLICDTLITEALNKRAECHLIMIDFKRAFDKIDHSILISKLSNFGIDSNIMFWIKDFLSNVQQYVVYGDSISRMTPVTSGVIQGSVIGALAFTLFINDLPEVIKHMTILMFAVDVKLVQPIKWSSDSEELQEDIISLAIWAEINRMPISYDKSCGLHYGSKYSKKQYTYYFPGNIAIPRVTETSDLGILRCDSFSYTTHINNIAASTRRLIGMVMKVIETITKIYTTYIRPKL